MGLRVSGRHMDVGEAFRSRIVDRLNELVAKYFDGNFSGSTVLSKEGARYCADITLHLDSGVDFQATADTHDPESSFIEASEKVEKRLRRYKRRLKDHKANAAGSREIAYTVISSVPDEDDEVPEDFAPAVIAETSLVMGTMSVANAVMELDRRDGPVVVFKNGATEEVNIVYRRPDGNVGWIDPSTLRARV